VRTEAAVPSPPKQAKQAEAAPAAPPKPATQAATAPASLPKHSGGAEAAERTVTPAAETVVPKPPAAEQKKPEEKNFDDVFG
jgi:hypothetical protein